MRYFFPFHLAFSLDCYSCGKLPNGLSEAECDREEPVECTNTKNSAIQMEFDRCITLKKNSGHVIKGCSNFKACEEIRATCDANTGDDACKVFCCQGNRCNAAPTTATGLKLVISCFLVGFGHFLLWK